MRLVLCARTENGYCTKASGANSSCRFCAAVLCSVWRAEGMRGGRGGDGRPLVLSSIADARSATVDPISISSPAATAASSHDTCWQPQLVCCDEQLAVFLRKWNSAAGTRICISPGSDGLRWAAMPGAGPCQRPSKAEVGVAQRQCACQLRRGTLLPAPIWQFQDHDLDMCVDDWA